MRRITQALVAAGLTAGITAAASLAVAQGVTPAKVEDAIKYRQSTMFLIGQHTGAMAAMVRGDRPFDQAAFVSHASLVDQLAKLPHGAFMVPGSDKGQTRMKAEAQTDKAKWEAAEKRFSDETAKLVSAARGGDQGAIRTAFGAYGASCKNCHESFRSQ